MSSFTKKYPDPEQMGKLSEGCFYKESIVFATGGINNFRYKERIKYVFYV